MSDTNVAVEVSLKRELNRIAGLGVLILLGGFGFLRALWDQDAAIQWLAQAACVWAILYYQTRKRLSLNRSHVGASLYSNLGWANRLTLLRSWLIASVAGFLFQPWPEGVALSWLPGLLYLCAAILDRVDGFVARRSGQSSQLGNDLDTVADALGLAIASLLAVGYGQAHVSYLLFGAAYYLFHAGILWRTARGLPLHPLPPSLHRRTWAGFQMGYLAVALWPLVYPPITTFGGFAFMLPAVLGFLVDWLIVSGRIDRNAETVDRRFRMLTSFSQGILQPTLRVVVVATLAISLLQSGLPPLPGNNMGLMNGIMLGGFALGALMVLLGIAGRYFSLILVSLLGWYFINNPMMPIDYVLFCSVIWLLLLGTGRFSLWTEDDQWLNRYDGA